MEVGAAAVGDTEPQELVAGPSALGEGDSQGWAFSGSFPGGPVVKTPHF